MGFALLILAIMMQGGLLGGGLLQKAGRLFRRPRFLQAVRQPFVEMEEPHVDDPRARAEALAEALEDLCGPYGTYRQRDSLPDQAAAQKALSCELTKVACSLEHWRRRIWGVRDDGELDALLPEREQKTGALWHASRARDLDGVEAVWQTLGPDERAGWGQALIEDEISRWKKLVRLGRLSRVGADDVHCFYIALGLNLLSPDHLFAQVASILRRLDGRSPAAIVARAREPWVDPDEEKVIEHSTWQLEDRAEGRIVAKLAFDEDAHEVAAGNFRIVFSEDSLDEREQLVPVTSHESGNNHESRK